LITWLRCFEAAARHKSFTRAASDLHLTQSAVSQQVRHLEQHLDARLFHRFPGRLELSHNGHRLFAEIAPALRRIEQAVNDVRTPEAPLHLSCSPSFANRWLMPRLGRFLRLHPEIDLHLRAEFHAISRDNFVREGLHAAIRYDPFTYDDFASHELMTEQLIPVASEEFVEKQRDNCGKPGLLKATLLHDSEPWVGAPRNVEWNTILEAYDLPADSGLRGVYFNLAELALASARSGEGIAAARITLAIEDLESRRLVPVVEQAVPANSRYVFLSVDDDDPRIESVLNWLKDECEQFMVRRQQLLPAQVGGGPD
jgi:DNA-binding transcriptional LysR family regulator